jgi:hypothetical protein
MSSPLKKNFFRIFFVVYIEIFFIFINFPVITGNFSPFTENVLLPVNEILYRTIITSPYPLHLIAKIRLGKEGLYGAEWD